MKARRILGWVGMGSIGLLLAACAGPSGARTARAGGTPNTGGDNIDPSSSQYNTDPAVANPAPRAASRSSSTGQGPAQQEEQERDREAEGDVE